MPRLVRVGKYLLNPDAIDYAEATQTTLSGNNLATKIYLRSGRECWSVNRLTALTRHNGGRADECPNERRFIP